LIKKDLDLPDAEYLLPGNRTCAGCSLSLAYRYILKALEGQAVAVVPASCLTVLHGMYPLTSVKLPCVNTPFPATAGFASGLAAGLRVTGKRDITVTAIAGDGGTYDIGLQGLSGAAERQSDILFICYDNEGYMNTGVQRSSSTPLGALTNTTPVMGKQQPAKDIAAIMEAHQIPYIAITSASYPVDIYNKVVKARKVKGTRFLLINTPCPPGWFFPVHDSVKMGRLSVETGMTVLYEIEAGQFRFTSASQQMVEKQNRKPLSDFLKRQGRFQSLSEKQRNDLQKWVDWRWDTYLARAGLNKSASV
jgi:pyruvate/2-oxoacid:ferredoxin oxidoreductase beta subunit